MSPFIKEKSVVMLSGGLDSAVNLAIASDKTNVVLALTFDYGQRSSSREIEAAEGLASHYLTAHKTIALPWLKDSGSALSDTSKTIPNLDIKDLDDIRKTSVAAASVWVPNRNGVFVSISASFAEMVGAELLVGGFNAEEGSTFPDNTKAFTEASSGMFKYSTKNHVRVTGYTIDMVKTEIARKAFELGVPLGLIWSCYEGDDLMCGTCEPCNRLKRAFQETYPELLSYLRMAT